MKKRKIALDPPLCISAQIRLRVKVKVKIPFKNLEEKKVKILCCSEVEREIKSGWENNTGVSFMQ